MACVVVGRLAVSWALVWCHGSVVRRVMSLRVQLVCLSWLGGRAAGDLVLGWCEGA